MAVIRCGRRVGLRVARLKGMRLWGPRCQAFPIAEGFLRGLRAWPAAPVRPLIIRGADSNPVSNRARQLHSWYEFQRRFIWERGGIDAAWSVRDTVPLWGSVLWED